MYFEPQLIELTGWEAQQISKGVNKAALYYVEQIVTMDLICFVYHVSPHFATG